MVTGCSSAGTSSSGAIVVNVISSNVISAFLDAKNPTYTESLSMLFNTSVP